MNKNNLVFCYPDTLFNKFLPQALQISIIKEFINTHGNKISFYTGENHITYKKLSLFQKKLKNKPNLRGFVFFSFMQFCYNEKVNLNLIEITIKQGYEIYFAKEKIALKNILELKKRKQDLIYYKTTNSEIINLVQNSFLN